MSHAETAALRSGEGGRSLIDIDAFPELVFLVSLDGHVIRANALVEQALGYAPESIAGRPYEDFVHPEDLAAAEGCLEQVVSGRPLMHNELRVRHRDGGYRWLECNAAAPEGGVFLLTARDISDQKVVAEQQQLLLETCPEALLALASDGRIAWSNAASERLFGLPRPLLKGRPVDTFLTVTTSSLLEQRPGQPLNCEALRGDGSREPVYLLCACPSEPGEFARVLSIRESRGPQDAETKRGETATDVEKSGYQVRDAAAESQYLVPGPGYDRIPLSTEGGAFQRVLQANPAARHLGLHLLELGFDMVLLHSDERVADINLKGAELLGAGQPGELVGRSLCDIVHPDYHALVQERIRRTVVEKREAQLMDLRLLRLDGTAVDVEVASVPVELDGRPATCTVARDVTRRRRAETALQSRDHYFHTLAKVAPVGIYQSNLDGEVVYANRRCNYILGIANERLNGSNWRRYVHPHDFDNVLAEWQRAVKAGRPFRAQHRYCRPDGTVVWVLSQAVAERDPAGNVLGYIGTITDITEIKQLQQQLADAEERSRKIVELAFDMVMLQRDRYVVDLNEGGARLLGLDSPERAVGRPIAELYPPEGQGDVFEGIRLAVENWEPTSLTEGKLLRRDGRMVDVEGAAIPVMYEGRPATYTVYRDISMRKHKERVLRERRHHFQALARAAPVGIFQSSEEWECTYVNERYVEITGHGYHATLGWGWKQQVHEADLPSLSAELERAQREEEPPFCAEYRVRRPDGETIWLLCQAVAERDSAGNRLGYIGTITDVTRSKTAELELQRYRDQLEEMVRDRTRELDVVNRELEAFSHSVSHDLRAPLRAMNGFTQALQEEYSEQFDEQARFYLNRIRANSTHMGALIEALLELSRVSQVDVHREAVDLSAIARTIIGELQMAEPARDVEVSIAEGLEAVGDRKLLRCLLQNLLGNAWKYTSHTEHACIEFGRRCADGENAFYVADNGAGFDMSCAENLFRAFHRLHPPTEFEGTGLGLATVQRVVNRHGGRVWAEAEEGRGATFFFLLQQEAAEKLSP